jgi:hypothetical protein
VHADVVATIPLRQILTRRPELDGDAPLELLPEAFGAELLHKVAHPVGPAVLPVAQLAEDLRYAAGDLHSFLRLHEHVYVGSHTRAVREAASHAHVEA